MRQVALIGAVAALALLAGVAVVGLPTSVVDDVVVSRRVAQSTTAPATSQPSTTTATTITTTTTTTTTAARPAGLPTTAESAVRRTTTRVRRTTTIPTTTTTTPPSTAAPTTTTLVAPEDLHVVVANASVADGLAAAMAARLRAMGYPRVDPTTAVDRRRISAVYFTDGLESEAQRLAAELDVPEVVARPPGPLTVDDAGGQLLVMIGIDRA